MNKTMYNSKARLSESKGAAQAKRVQVQEQKKAMADDAFVKAEQARVKSLAGKVPNLEKKYTVMDGCMTVNGKAAQELARKLTTSIDHTAFPVK